jgi:hypothetical protein
MFEIDNPSIFGIAETCGSDHELPAVSMIKSTISQITDGPRKIVLPRRPGEPRFAPPGVVVRGKRRPGSASASVAEHEFLCHQRANRQGRRFGWLGGRGCSLPATRGDGWSRWQNMEGLSQFP